MSADGDALDEVTPDLVQRIEDALADDRKDEVRRLLAGMSAAGQADVLEQVSEPQRDALVGMVRDWHAAIRKAILLAQEVGHLVPEADPDQVLFEMHGLILSLHHDARFLRSPGALARARTGLERILDSFATPAGRKADAQTRQTPPHSASASPAPSRKRA